MNKATLLLALAALATTALAEVPAPVVRAAFEKIDPAIALVEFSVEITNPATGERNKQDRNALGLVVSPTGLVMTHGHMKIDNADPFNVTVTIGEGENEKEYEAEVLPKPEDVNIVLLQLVSDTPLNLPHVRFTRAPLGLGDHVVSFGMLAEPLDYITAMQQRRVGAVLDVPRTTYALDEAVRFGYVGGPVINEQGQLVGVVGFDLTEQEGGDLYIRSGHPLIYQTELFQKYIDNPPVEKAVEAPNDAWLGVFTQPLTEDFARYWELPLDGGLIVSTVVPGSPAGVAGLQPGDIITQFNGTPIRAKTDRDVLGFTKLVRETGAGAAVTIDILREKQPQSVSLTLGIRPRTAQDAPEYEDKLLGMTVRELTADVRIQLNLGEDVQGVIVRRVESGSPAQAAKIRPGVILLAFDNAPVGNLESYKQVTEQIRQARPSEITVFARAGAVTGFFRVQPRWE
ncbi:MAG: hypothetical protein RLZZ303_414 [Candidatus Hydrogenedentota bacterium]|jgi:serine protease Do